MPRQMYTHNLEILKGLTALSGFQLDFQAQFDATEKATITGGYIPTGRCVSLNSSGKFRLGAEGGVPMWLLQNSDDNDVAIDGGDLSTDSDAFATGYLNGIMNAVVAGGGHMLGTTEFQTSLTYAPNEPLKAPLGDGSASQLLNTAGKLTNATCKFYQHWVVGVVAEGRNSGSPKNAHGKHILVFWPYFLPKIQNITEPTWV